MNNSLVQDRLASVNRVLSGAFGKTEITPQEIADAISDIKVRDGLIYAVSDHYYINHDPAWLAEQAETPALARDLLLKKLHTVNDNLDINHAPILAMVSAIYLLGDDPSAGFNFAHSAMSWLFHPIHERTEMDLKLGNLATLIHSGFTANVPPFELAKIFRDSVSDSPFDVVISNND
jgi:hypothetical protein